MLQSEFEARVKMQVSCEEYQSINEVYNNSEVDKDEFCAIWVKMNRTRVKRAMEKRKKAEELMALKDKVWDIYMKVRALPCIMDCRLAIDKLSARDIKTLSKAGYEVEKYNISTLRYKLYRYLHS